MSAQTGFRPHSSRRGRLHRGALIAAVLGVVAVGCSGDDDAGPGSDAATSAETTTAPTSVPTTSPQESDDAESTATSAPTSTTVPPTTVPPTTAPPSIDDVRLDELQVIGSHNSYHLAPEGALKAGLEAIVPPFAAGLDYSHRPLAEQLEVFGVRHLEIDVHADPDGGLYSRRVGLEVVGEPADSGLAELDAPGFKVLHIQDVDFGTTCLTLVACLSEVEAWSSANPTHVPVHVMIEVKSETIEEIAVESGFELPDLGVVWTVPVPTTSELLEDLEGEILSVFDRDRIIAPDDVRGGFATLPEALAADGWPTLGESRGMMMFSLNNRDATADLYRTGAPALEGRLMFTHADPGAPDAAVVLLDDPIADADRIAEALAAGYLVRTRSDEPSTPAGDTARRDAALASGAHYVSTDVYDDVGRGFVVRLPGDAVVRCNPVTRSQLCDDAALTE